MESIPILIIAFNRPDRLIGLIESLRATKPPVVRVAVDGPRVGRPDDLRRVSETRAAVERIDWTADVATLTHETNLGCDGAPPAAVSWVLNEFESVIVFEDDAVLGPQFIEFATRALREFKQRSDIFHVNGYNVVPRDRLTNPAATARLSRVPETYAWATWRRAWKHNDPKLTWGSDCTIAELAAVLQSRTAAIRWKQNFSLARHGRISTYSYRWAASMWSQGGYCLSPNRNLVGYDGFSDGTHTRRRRRWAELPIEAVDLDGIAAGLSFDAKADEYLQRQIFRSTPLGIGLGPVEALALEVLKRR